ncbi:MAG: ComEC/Rec2 family competence protein, partial [Clostridia bacterium]|nr:ComEC/Rec2 family competence protein [Clostridia bacterium]
MKKLVNLRIPVLLACFLAFGTAVGYVFHYFSIDLLWITATVPTVAVILIFVRKGAHVRVTIVLTAVIFIVGAVATYIKIDNFGKSQIADNTYCSISATVSDKSANARGEYIILTNITANDTKINGKMIAYLGEFYGDFCDIGYTVQFKTAINKNRTFEYGKSNYFLAENVKYNCYVNSGVRAEEGFSLFGSIRIAIRNMLFENLDGETAAIAYGMLTGNTQYIEDGALQNFRYGGIAHIFAVSGLHIGIVYGLFYFLSKRLRLNRWATICLCLLPVFFYVGICGFTLSSVRAAVMCTVSLFARKFHKKYDGLNSLALSIIIILLINPLNMLSVGFQLSVCAVGGIVLLSSRLTCRFKKVPRKIAKPVGVALGAQAGTLPVMLTNFGYISGAGLLLNIIIVPILSIQFIVMFISTVIALIVPFASSVIIPYSVLPLEFIVSFFIDSGFENALIKGFGAGLFLPVYYIGLAILSDKINMKLLTRIIALGCTVVILISYVLVKMFIPFSDFTVAVSAYYNGGEVLIKSHLY